MKNATLLNELHEYEAWRKKLSDTISNYRNWLASSPQTDSIRELRLHDMLEIIQHDEIVIAFLADESSGKAEAINALFFPDLKLNLFPSEIGKSAQCSTEIYWNTNEEPSISLLSVSTRRTEDTLTYLKTTPNAWERHKLNLSSVEEMQATLNKLTEQSEVTQNEAISLGLWNPNDEVMVDMFKKTGRVKIPAWRHAMINYPHPVLQNGLVIIDTPNLDKLNAEPELTQSIIPKADAVIFLTSTDTDVSANDQTIWNDFIKHRTRHKFVLLNNIDTLSKRQSSKQQLDIDIDRLVNVTAHQLRTTPDIVFPVSAQQALSAKAENNAELLAYSKFTAFEEALGNHLTQSKHTFFGKNIANECSVMIKDTRKIIQKRKLRMQAQIEELKALKGKNISESEQILKKVVAEKKRYEASIPTFNLANEKISKHGQKLLKHLSVEYLDSSIQESRKEIGDSWTTIGLNQGMRNVMKQANELADYVTTESKKIKKLADHVYGVFQSKHGFEIFEAPDLDMSNFLNDIRALEKITDEFCKDPINVMTEKYFLVRRFFLGLGVQKQKIFEQAYKECEHWLLDVLSTLKSQMNEHKSMLSERTKNLMKANDSAKSLNSRLKTIEQEYAQLITESKAIDAMLLHIVTSMQPAMKAQLAEKHTPGLDGTLNMPEMLVLPKGDSDKTSSHV